MTNKLRITPPHRQVHLNYEGIAESWAPPDATIERTHAVASAASISVADRLRKTVLGKNPRPFHMAAVTSSAPTGSQTAAQVAHDIRQSNVYANASPTEKAALEAVLQRLTTQGIADDVRALQKVLGSPFWSAASAADRNDMLTLFGQIPLQEVDKLSGAQGHGVRRATVALAEMATRNLHGAPMLLDHAHGGGTLVHELAHLGTGLGSTPASTEILQKTQLSPAMILAGTILEVNDSGRLAQGNVGTCTATTVTIILDEQNPAEYVRLASGILVNGYVKMRNGDKLFREPTAIAPTPGNSRTPSERLLQSAFMEYGDSADYQIRTKGNEVEDVQVGTVYDELPTWVAVLSWILFLPAIIMKLWPYTHGGMACRQVDKVAEGVFGQDWSQRYSSAEGLWVLHANHSASNQVDWLLKRAPNGDFANDRITVGLDWASSAHMLKLEHIDPPGTRPRMVALHNPWGSYPFQSPGDPAFGCPPKTIWVDPERGIIAMPLDEFERRLNHLNYSDTRPAA